MHSAKHTKKIAAKVANIKEHDMVLRTMKCYPVTCLYHIGYTHPHYKQQKKKHFLQLSNYKYFPNTFFSVLHNKMTQYVHLLHTHTHTHTHTHIYRYKRHFITDTILDVMFLTFTYTFVISKKKKFPIKF
jgi:hypothetical protein